MNLLKVIITGISGDIGKGISKILKERIKNIGIIGVDIKPDVSNRVYGDNFYQLPSVKDESYYIQLKRIITLEQPNIIIPTSEDEIYYFIDNEIYSILGALVLVTRGEVSKIGRDKWLTILKLQKSGVEVPKTEILQYAGYNGGRHIVKSRRGAGSKNICIIENELDFNYYKVKYPNWIIQEYLSSAKDEYTCCIYKDDKIEKYFILNRELIGGRTGKGKVVNDSEIIDYLRKISSLFDFTGSINIQLRLTEKGPRIFEINPRFSSTVFMRDLLGFQDLIWSLNNLMSLPNKTNYSLEQIDGKLISIEDDVRIYE